MNKIYFLLFFCILGVYVFSTYVQPPVNGVYPVTVIYNENETVATFSETLYSHNIIKHKKLFRALLVLQGYDKTLKPNEYVFEAPLGLFQVVEKIGKDSRLAKGIRVVIPEGSTVEEIQTIVYKAFPKFKSQNNKVFTKKDEGYLFPDTYYFSINSTEQEIVKKLKQTFINKTEKYFINKTENEIKDAVIMASILEKEGKGIDERYVISGILWKRILLDMPLQVDATFLYTIQKGSSDLTITDLKTNNPYNTYTNKGLPVGPINNPGLETIIAALNPKKSPYLYYLHDATGLIHYGKTFEEHKKNKSVYLK